MLVPRTEVVVRRGDEEIARHEVEPGEYVIGREPPADIVVEASLVSRRHARLIVNYDEWLIEDLGSSNGTCIGDKRISGVTKIFPSQKVVLGDVTLELRKLIQADSADHSLPPVTAELHRLLPASLAPERKYEIGKVVAQGGMGAILDAREMTIRRTVAMKVMLDHNSRDDVMRFIEEAQITGQLEHPNIVPIHELGLDEQDHPFYTMKFVKGVTLKEVLAKIKAGDTSTIDKFPLRRLLITLMRVCDAVAFANSKNVIHRDLKPENVMIGDFGEVLVMDWGLAKVLGRKEQPQAKVRVAQMLSIRRDDAVSVTMAGTLMGTPNFMAPEQANGEVDRIDARTDVYALGAILYTILTLRPPAVGSSVDEVLAHVRNHDIAAPTSFNSPPAKYPKGEIPLPHCPGRRIPSALSAIAMKALSLEQEDRYRSANELKADVDAYLAGFATKAEKAGLHTVLSLLVKRNKAVFSVVSAALLVVCALAVWFVFNIAHERNLAERALADLKKQAPVLRQLAESEASFQHFDFALEKLDTALALDPAHLPSYWRRAWLFIGMNRLQDAATAIRLAQQKDPEHKDLAAILPVIDKLAALPPAAPWPGDCARQVRDQLMKVNAVGEIAAIATKLELTVKDNVNLVRKRLDEWLGNGKGKVQVKQAVVRVDLSGIQIATLAPLRGLPFEDLEIGGTKVADLEPLHGMRLLHLGLASTRVADLSPLRGMPLRDVNLAVTEVTDLSPLQGAPLEWIDLSSTKIADLSPLQGAPLTYIKLERLHVDLSPLRGAPLRSISACWCGLRDLAFLSSCPLESLDVHDNSISDLSPLRGKKLRTLYIWNNNITDLSPLRGMPIKGFWTAGNRISDFTPLLELPNLEILHVDRAGKHLEPLRNHPSLKFMAYGSDSDRPVAEFWAEWEKVQNSPIGKARDAVDDMGVPRDRVNTAEDGTLVVDLGGSKAKDLTPLKGLPISSLRLSGTTVTDLALLQGMHLKVLDLGGSETKDLTRLKGLPISELRLSGTTVTDLTPLRDLPLKSLECAYCPVLSDLSPLHGMALEFLGVGGTKVKDLAPLRGMPLKMVALDKIPDLDVSPLADCKQLEEIILPKQARNLKALRALPNLKGLAWDWPGSWENVTPAAKFWTDFDAKKGATTK